MTAPVRPRRSDALRNEERVLAAARDVFARKGLAAGVEEIAAAAGVGKATVYRAYPTKQDLLAAVLGARVEWFTALTLEAVRSDDPWAAYADLLATAAVSACESALLHAGLTAASPELEALRAVSREAMQVLLDRAGADVSAQEVTVLLCGAFRTLREDGVTDVAHWLRYADLVVQASR